MLLAQVKDSVLRVSAMDLEVGLGFGLGDWLVLRLLTSVIIGLGGLPLVSVSRYHPLINLRWTVWFQFDHTLHLYLISLIIMLKHFLNIYYSYV